MNKPKDISGHFSSLPSTEGHAPTTVTTQLKRRTREIHEDKRQQLLAEIRRLTGDNYSGISTPLDGVTRRWKGVKGNSADR